MDLYEKVERQALRFRKVYPRELPERLEGWQTTLGLDRCYVKVPKNLIAFQAAGLYITTQHPCCRDTIPTPCVLLWAFWRFSWAFFCSRLGAGPESRRRRTPTLKPGHRPRNQQFRGFFVGEAQTRLPWVPSPFEIHRVP